MGRLWKSQSEINWSDESSLTLKGNPGFKKFIEECSDYDFMQTKMLFNKNVKDMLWKKNNSVQLLFGSTRGYEGGTDEEETTREGSFNSL